MAAQEVLITGSLGRAPRDTPDVITKATHSLVKRVDGAGTSLVLHAHGEAGREEFFIKSAALSVSDRSSVELTLQLSSEVSEVYELLHCASEEEAASWLRVTQDCLGAQDLGGALPVVQAAPPRPPPPPPGKLPPPPPPPPAVALGMPPPPPAPPSGSLPAPTPLPASTLEPVAQQLPPVLPPTAPASAPPPPGDDVGVVLPPETQPLPAPDTDGTAQLRTDVAEAREEKRALDTQVALLRRDAQSAAVEVASLRARVVALESDLARAHARIDERQPPASLPAPATTAALSSLEELAAGLPTVASHASAAMEGVRTVLAHLKQMAQEHDAASRTQTAVSEPSGVPPRSVLSEEATRAAAAHLASMLELAVLLGEGSKALEEANVMRKEGELAAGAAINGLNKELAALKQEIGGASKPDSTAPPPAGPPVAPPPPVVDPPQGGGALPPPPPAPPTASLPLPAAPAKAHFAAAASAVVASAASSSPAAPRSSHMAALALLATRAKKVEASINSAIAAVEKAKGMVASVTAPQSAVHAAPLERPTSATSSLAALVQESLSALTAAQASLAAVDERLSPAGSVAAAAVQGWVADRATAVELRVSVEEQRKSAATQNGGSVDRTLLVQAQAQLGAVQAELVESSAQLESARGEATDAAAGRLALLEELRGARAEAASALAGCEALRVELDSTRSAALSASSEAAALRVELDSARSEALAAEDRVSEAEGVETHGSSAAASAPSAAVPFFPFLPSLPGMVAPDMAGMALGLQGQVAALEGQVQESANARTAMEQELASMRYDLAQACDSYNHAAAELASLRASVHASDGLEVQLAGLQEELRDKVHTAGQHAEALLESQAAAAALHRRVIELESSVTSLASAAPASKELDAALAAFTALEDEVGRSAAVVALVRQEASEAAVRALAAFDTPHLPSPEGRGVLEDVAAAPLAPAVPETVVQPLLPPAPLPPPPPPPFLPPPPPPPAAPGAEELARLTNVLSAVQADLAAARGAMEAERAAAVSRVSTLEALLSERDVAIRDLTGRAQDLAVLHAETERSMQSVTAQHAALVVEVTTLTSEGARLGAELAALTTELGVVTAQKDALELARSTTPRHASPLEPATVRLLAEYEERIEYLRFELRVALESAWKGDSAAGAVKGADEAHLREEMRCTREAAAALEADLSRARAEDVSLRTQTADLQDQLHRMAEREAAALTTGAALSTRLHETEEERDAIAASLDAAATTSSGAAAAAAAAHLASRQHVEIEELRAAAAAAAVAHDDLTARHVALEVTVQSLRRAAAHSAEELSALLADKAQAQLRLADVAQQSDALAAQLAAAESECASSAHELSSLRCANTSLQARVDELTAPTYASEVEADSPQSSQAARGLPPLALSTLGGEVVDDLARRIAEAEAHLSALYPSPRDRHPASPSLLSDGGRGGWEGSGGYGGGLDALAARLTLAEETLDMALTASHRGSKTSPPSSRVLSWTEAEREDATSSSLPLPDGAASLVESLRDFAGAGAALLPASAPGIAAAVRDKAARSLTSALRALVQSVSVPVSGTGLPDATALAASVEAVGVIVRSRLDAKETTAARVAKAVKDATALSAAQAKARQDVEAARREAEGARREVEAARVMGETKARKEAAEKLVLVQAQAAAAARDAGRQLESAVARAKAAEAECAAALAQLERERAATSAAERHAPAPSLVTAAASRETSESPYAPLSAAETPADADGLFLPFTPAKEPRAPSSGRKRAKKNKRRAAEEAGPVRSGVLVDSTAVLPSAAEGASPASGAPSPSLGTRGAADPHVAGGPTSPLSLAGVLGLLLALSVLQSAYLRWTCGAGGGPAASSNDFL